MTTADIINGLKHTADDHPCCRATMEEAISKLELLKKSGELMATHLEIAAKFPPPEICGRHTIPWKHAAKSFRILV